MAELLLVVVAAEAGDVSSATLVAASATGSDMAALLPSRGGFPTSTVLLRKGDLFHLPGLWLLSERQEIDLLFECKIQPDVLMNHVTLAHGQSIITDQPANGYNILGATFISEATDTRIHPMQQKAITNKTFHRENMQ